MASSGNSNSDATVLTNNLLGELTTERGEVLEDLHAILTPLPFRNNMERDEKIMRKMA